MIKQTANLAGASALAALLAACAGDMPPPFPLPDEPGLYAISRNDELQRLDGGREWEVKSWPARAALGPYTEFVIYDPELEREMRPRHDLVDLWRVAWVRSEVDSAGRAAPVQGSQWAVAPIEPFRVPVTLDFAPGRPEYVHVRPQRPLDPGLYSLRLKKLGINRVGRMGVHWDGVDKREYSAANCVDRHADREPGYRTCADNFAGVEYSAVEGLEITLVDPLRRDDVLVVQGVVVNTTADSKAVPTMRALLLDREGRQLTQAVIEPRQVELGAGERMTFKTEIPGAPAATARIDVDFAPTTSAGM
ncbi:MAG: FxLYD domain-containing protein [Kiloniellaceae bacterium]